MAITDNLAIRIQAEAGQTVITDSIASLVVNDGTGTATLVDDATHGHLWRITGGTKSAVLSGMGTLIGSVTTIALRFRLVTRGANYNKFFTLGNSVDNGILIINNGTNTSALRTGGRSVGTVAAAIDIPYTTDTVVTYVYRLTEGATDLGAAWVNTVDRVGTDPNYSASATKTFGASTITLLQFLVTTETFDVLDCAVWTRGLTDAESAAVADDIRTTLNASPDTTAPVLTSPTGTPTGQTTASGTVTASETGGTLYWLASANATELLATVKAGSSQAVSTLSQTVAVTGLTASTAYYLHYAHTDGAALDSAVVTSAQFTTAAAGDATVPTLTGVITTSLITQTTYTLSWPAGADNVGVTAYEYNLNGGAFISTGTATTVNITGRTADGTDTVTVRAKDAAGNVSTPVLSTTVNLLAVAAPGITTPVLKNNTGTVLGNEAGVVVNVYNASTGALVLRKEALTSNASGIVTFTDAALSAATSYAYEVVLTGGRRRLPLVTTA